MAHLVGDHVSLRKVAGSAEATRQLLVKTEIDVHVPVGGTIERTNGGAAGATAGGGPVREQHQPRLLVRLVAGGEGLGPGALDVVENERNELLLFVGCRTAFTAALRGEGL